MMNAIIYIYYRLKKIDSTYGNAVRAIQFSALILLNLMPLVAIVEDICQINHLEFLDSFFKDDDSVTMGLIKLVLLFSPLIIVVYFFLRMNNEKIETGCKALESMSEKERKRKNKLLWIYLISSFGWMIVGVTASGPYGWINWIRNW